MKLTILETSDTHGFVLPTNYVTENETGEPYSLERVATYFRQVEATHASETIIKIDAGDFLQGSALANYVSKHQSTANINDYAELYNAIGYDFGVLGNHDFNFGLDYQRKILEQTTRLMLNANILKKSTNLPFIGQPYKIIERSGLKIAIIGVTTQHIPHWEDVKHIPDLKFVSAEEVLAKTVAELRPQVDLVVVAYHGGFERDLVTNEPTEKYTGENEGWHIAQNVPGIDILLTGHQHRKIASTLNGVTVVQPGYQGAEIGQVEVEFELNDEQKPTITKITPSLVDTKDFALDPQIVSKANCLNTETEEWLNQVIGSVDHDLTFANASDARINGTDYLNFIHQVQLAETGADISADSILREDMHGLSEEITLRDLIGNNPYANEFLKVKLNGAQLREILEYTASFFEKKEGKIVFRDKFIHPKYQLYHFDTFYPIEYSMNIDLPMGHRVEQLQFNKQAVTDNQEFSLIVNKFRALGGGNYPAYPELEPLMEYTTDLVTMITNYLATNSPVIVDRKKNYKIY